MSTAGPSSPSRTSPERRSGSFLSFVLFVVSVLFLCDSLLFLCGSAAGGAGQVQIAGGANGRKAVSARRAIGRAVGRAGAAHQAGAARTEAPQGSHHQQRDLVAIFRTLGEHLVDD